MSHQPNHTEARPDKSTTVREKTGAERLLAASLRLASPAPTLAARILERWVFTPTRHPRPAAEVALLGRSDRRFSLDLDGHSVPVWSWGSGPVALLVHGWAGRGSQLAPFVAPLCQAGFRVVTFDGPGHGDSTAPTGSLPQQVRAVLAVAAAVGPVDAVIAHSMGASASAIAEHLGLGARSLVLVAPPAHPGRFTDGIKRRLDVGDEVVSALRLRAEQRLGMRFDDLDVEAIAPRLRAPALVVHDEHDREVPFSDGAAVASAWPGATLHRTSGLGHNRILQNPSVLARAVSFVRRRDSATLAPSWSPVLDDQGPLHDALGRV